MGREPMQRTRVAALVAAAVMALGAADGWAQGAGAGGKAGDAAAHLAAGDAAFRAFDSAKAAAEYEKAHELAPDDYRALAMATLATRDAGEEFKVQGKKEAERYFERALALAQEMLRRYPDRAEAHYYVASTSGQLALYRGAREKVRLSREVEQYAKSAIALDPNDARPHGTLGVYYREVANASPFLKVIARNLLGGLPNGTNEDAERELRRALELDAGDVWATYELARTYEVMDKRDLEAEALKKVVALPARFQRDARLKRQAAERLAALAGAGGGGAPRRADPGQSPER
jgi:tetratricopeptide (TPR) repeat protein